MKLNVLEDLFVQELSELYGSEQQILKALPKMVKSASHESLQEAFSEHKKETKDQIIRLEKIFKLLGEESQKPKSYPIKGVLLKGDEIIHTEADSAIRDAALIAVAQKVEHFEIAGYGAARTHAALLGYEEVASLLEASLKEEEAMDARLTQLAKESVNLDAARAPYGQARTRVRSMAKAQATSGSGSTAGHLLIGLSLGAALALFLGSADWRKPNSKIIVP